MGCGKQLAPQELDASDGDEKLLCSAHDNTYQTGYKYNTKISFVQQYNTLDSFQDSVDVCHTVVNRSAEREHDQGRVNEGKDIYAECTREYDVWTNSAPLDNYMLSIEGSLARIIYCFVSYIVPKQA